MLNIEKCVHVSIPKHQYSKLKHSLKLIKILVFGMMSLLSTICTLAILVPRPTHSESSHEHVIPTGNFFRNNHSHFASTPRGNLNEPNGSHIEAQGFTVEEVEHIINSFASIAAQPGMPVKTDKTWFRTLAAGVAQELGKMLKEKGYERFDMVMCNEIPAMDCGIHLADYDVYRLIIVGETRIFGISIAVAAFQNEVAPDSDTASETFETNLHYSPTLNLQAGTGPPPDQYCLACPIEPETYSCNVLTALAAGTISRRDHVDPFALYLMLQRLPNFKAGNFAYTFWKWDASPPDSIPPYDVYYHFAKPMLTHCADWSPIVPGKQGFLVISEKLKKEHV